MHYEENTVAFRRSLSLLYKYMYIYMLLCFFFNLSDYFPSSICEGDCDGHCIVCDGLYNLENY